MSSTDGCAIFRWIIGVGLDQKKKIKIKKIEKNLSVLLRYDLKLIVPPDPTSAPRCPVEPSASVVAPPEISRNNDADMCSLVCVVFLATVC